MKNDYLITKFYCDFYQYSSCISTDKTVTSFKLFFLHLPNGGYVFVPLHIAPGV